MKKTKINPWKLWLLLVGLLLAGACAAAVLYLRPPDDVAPAAGASLPDRPLQPGPQPHESSGPSRAPAARDGRARVAIVLDDIGGDRQIVGEIAALQEYPLTIAVLPHLEHTRFAASTLRGVGMEILVHLPMEPLSYPRDNPGRVAVFEAMDPRTIRNTVASCLDQVPEAVGVNNHMGSKATASRTCMLPVMQEIGARSLFFLDSRTHKDSVAASTARQQGLRTVSRNVFLDNESDEGKIAGQLDQLVDHAKRKGYAVGIGHGRRNTLKVLKRWLPLRARDPGFRFVFVSEVVS